MQVPPPTFLPVDLPHTGAMRWIDAAHLSEDGGTARARLIVAADHPFVRDGHLPPSALIELMAQTAAAGSVLKAAGAGRRIKRGVLVALRDFTVTNAIAVGRVLDVTADHDKSFGRLSQATVEVRQGTLVAARARMTFHLEFE